jgi:hypothetical protein
VEKVDDENRKWKLTKLAEELINGGKINKSVRVYDNKVIEVLEETIGLEDAIGFYQPPAEWSKNAERLSPKEENQLTFI